MKQPKYLKVEKLDDALEALSEWGDDAKVLAGGTDLLIGIRRGTVQPDCVIDITRVAELKGIHQENGRIIIGALATHSQVNLDAAMPGWAPVLVTACREVGSRQIRNRATIGGNLANASPAGDSIPALYVLGAEVRLQSAQSDRWVAVNEFFTGPGATLRQSDEMLTAVRFVPFTVGEKGFFNKIGQRRAMTIAKVSAAGALLFEGNTIQRCRLALGAVAPTVIRLPRVEAFLVGQALSPEVIAEASSMAGEVCSPIDDIRSTVAYRCHTSGVLVKRGLNSIMQEVELE